MTVIIFLYSIYFLSIGIHVLAFLLTLICIIPLQLKEAFVRNGLGILRKQLLAFGITNMIISAVTIIVLSLRFFVTDVTIIRYVTTFLILLHSVGFLIIAYLCYQIYHQQYTEHNKQMHDKIAEYEKGNVLTFKKNL